MAILNDLAKETSFRRFYLRWLAACWVPVLCVVVIWLVVWFAKDAKIFARIRFVTPLELWVLVGIGQWYFLRHFSSRALQWAFATFIAGLAATFFWAGMTNYKVTGAPSLLSLLALKLALFAGLPSGSHILAVLGGVAFGFTVSLAQIAYLSKDLVERSRWLVSNAVIGGLVFTLLLPLQGPLLALRGSAMRGDWSDPTMLIPVSFLMMLPTYLLIGWFAYSAATGFLLWRLCRQNAELHRTALPRIFD